MILEILRLARRWRRRHADEARWHLSPVIEHYQHSPVPLHGGEPSQAQSTEKNPC